MAKKKRYDLVLMDIQMPEMDGLSAARALRNDGHKELLIIALSAYASPEEQERSLKAGMDAHLNKPFKLKNLQGLLLHWFPDKALRNYQGVPATDKCWADELPRMPGLALSEETCSYWLKKEDFLKRVGTFIQSASKVAEALHEAIDARDFPAALTLLHKFKGSAKLYAAKRLLESIEQLENALNTEDAILPDALHRFDAAVSELSSGTADSA